MTDESEFLPSLLARAIADVVAAEETVLAEKSKGRPHWEGWEEERTPDGQYVKDALWGKEWLARALFSPLPEGVEIAVKGSTDFGDLPPEFLASSDHQSKRPAQDQWEQDRERALAATQRPAWLSATNIAKHYGPGAPSGDPNQAEYEAGLGKDLDEDNAESADRSARSGRYGTQFGSAVHGVLQRLDLAEAVDAVAGTASTESIAAFDLAVAKFSKAQADAEGVSELDAEVEQRVRIVLADPTVVAAARANHWQEIYVGTDLSEIVVDGFIDLLYEDTASSDFVVLDFKTVYTTDPKILRGRTQGYKPQGAAYAYCVQKITGRKVCRVEFAYITEGSVQVHTVEGDELAAAIDEVVKEVQQKAQPEPAA